MIFSWQSAAHSSIVILAGRFQLMCDIRAAPGTEKAKSQAG